MQVAVRVQVQVQVAAVVQVLEREPGSELAQELAPERALALAAFPLEVLSSPWLQ
eukprot:COSAG02_NODE_24292_length_692_cov_1.730185_1_plen_55_part_00